MGRVITMSAEIRIYKADRKLDFLMDGIVKNTFRIGLGFTPVGGKSREGDGRTPEGDYYICTKNLKSKFTLFLGISYPNIADAEKGLERGIINTDELDEIKKAIHDRKRPNWDTQLGGQIGIHGKGNSFDWTAGCISLNDEDIMYLWDNTQLGDQVTIFA
jgi:murein L,D-transpeptidase YafK